MEVADPVPLVGREQELRALEGAVARILSGRAAGCCVVGGPGAGKTRLVRWLRAHARDRGIDAGVGRGLDSGSELVLAPVCHALRTVLRGVDGRQRARLTGDLHALAPVFPELALPPPAPLGDPMLERTRLVDSLVRLVERRLGLGPLVLVFDDLHRLDPASLEYVASLLRAVAALPLLVAVTLADGWERHVPERSAATVRALLADLRDAPWSAPPRLLAPLSADQCVELVAGALGGPVERASALELAERADRAPGPIESLLRAGVSGGAVVFSDGCWRLDRVATAAVPHDLRAQIRSRWAHLDEAAVAVLRLLAIADGDVDHRTLAVATGIAEPEVLAVLDRLGRERLVDMTGDDLVERYELAELLRDTIVGDLPVLSARRAHLLLADAFERTGAARGVVVDHIVAAGPLADPHRAVEASAIEGRCALDEGAPERAEPLLRAAVGYARASGRTDVLAGLEADRARACDLLGDRDEARRAWQAALEGHVTAGDSRAAAEVHRRLALLEWETAHPEDAFAHVAAGHRELAGLEPSTELVELLHTEVILHVRRSDAAAIERVSGRLAELADRFGRSDLRARSLLAAAAGSFARCEYDQARDQAREAWEQARSSDDWLLRQRTVDVLSVVAATTGDLAELAARSQESLDLAVAQGALRVAAWPRYRLAVGAILTGAWDRARVHADAALEQARRIGCRRSTMGALSASAWLLAWSGEVATARRTVDEARALLDDGAEPDRNLAVAVLLADARVALEAGDPDRALQVVAAADDWVFGLSPVRAAAVAGEAALLAGDRVRADRAVQHLSTLRGRVEPYARALTGRLRALDALPHDADEAAEHARRSAEDFDRLGFVVDRARCDLVVARAGARDAVECARRAQRTFEALGASRYAARARAVLRRHGVRPAARGGDGATALSERQLEVARLVAEGMSNQEIAEALYISRRTVTTHLDNIYGRLGLGSRVALTRFLQEHDLLEPGRATHPRREHGAGGRPATRDTSRDR